MFNVYDKIISICRPRISTDNEFFVIQNVKDVCRASVGRNNGKNRFLSLDPDLCQTKSIYHEMLHAIGILHEHARTDRDNYIKIHTANIPYGFDSEFILRKKSDNMNLPYDATSLMHYTTKQGSGTDHTITSKVNVILILNLILAQKNL